MLRSFIRYIVAQLPDLVIATTIHEGDFPQNAPDLCSFVSEKVPGYRHKYNTRRSEKRYQIMTRGGTYNAAETEANRICNAVVNLRGIDLSPYVESGEDTHTLYITEGTEPAYIGRDPKTRFLFTSNITLRIRKES